MQKMTMEEQLAHRDAERAMLIAALNGTNWRGQFDERQRRLIKNCQTYAQNDPAGLPGHNLAIIVSKLVNLLDKYTQGKD